MPTPRIGYIGESLDLLIRQGADFGPYNATMINPDQSLVDLTGCTIRGQIRKHALDTAIVITFNTTVLNQITYPGKYKFWLTNIQTAGLTTGETLASAESKFVWDLELLDSAGYVTPLYYGNVTIQREVTR